MAPEQFGNNAFTTLTQTALVGDLTLKLNNAAAPFPQVPQFRVKCENEIMLVTAVTPGNGGGAPVPTAAAGTTSFHAGTFTVGYTWVMAAGETVISPTANVVLTPGQQINVAQITGIPSYVTSLNFYLSAVPAGDTTGFTVSQTVSGGTVNAFSITAEGNGMNAPGSNPANVWVVARAQETTIAAQHNNGTPIVHDLTSNATLAFLRGDGGPNIITSTVGPPTAGTYTAGATYIDSKGALWFCSVGGAPGTWLYIGGGPYHTSAYCGHGQAINASSTPVLANVDTIDYDPDSDFNVSTHLWTCRVAGIYSVKWNLIVDANMVFIAAVHQVGSRSATYSGPSVLDSSGNTPISNGSADIKCAVNDTLGLYAQFTSLSTGNLSGVNTIGQNFISIKLIGS